MEKYNKQKKSLKKAHPPTPSDDDPVTITAKHCTIFFIAAAAHVLNLGRKRR